MKVMGVILAVIFATCAHQCLFGGYSFHTPFPLFFDYKLCRVVYLSMPLQQYAKQKSNEA